jgi:uncharacterized protein YndB with AHSA1/START domain
MAKANEQLLDTHLNTLAVSRVYRAPRELVFRAWTSAAHLKRWFCPARYTVPEAEVEFRVDGAFNICMRSPEGHDHWIKGQYTGIVPHTRLEIDMSVIGKQDKPLFRAYTVASFADEGGGTLLKVTQSYTLFDPLAASMIQGASQGWEQTLDRLEHEVARMQKSVPTPHNE